MARIARSGKLKAGNLKTGNLKALGAATLLAALLVPGLVSSNGALASGVIKPVGSSNPFAPPPAPAATPAEPQATAFAPATPKPDAVKPQAADNPATVCQRAVRGAEKAMGIPAHLLHAVALVESGKLVSDITQDAEKTKKMAAWPWTVMAEGRGRYLPDQASAIAEVKALQARGIRNIDVGCMQINLHYHGKAFSSLEEAFEPVNNVAYAAAFLTRLNRERHSWTRAVGYYHSSNPKRLLGYQRKVLGMWKQLERVAIAAHSQSSPANPGGIRAVSARANVPWNIRSYRDQHRAEIYARSKAVNPQ